MSTGTTATPAALENPWPGLAPYTEQQHESFFGREAETEELLRLIQRETLTVLFGRSGSGKSSLLHAGVIPRLRSGMYFPVLLRLNFANPDADPVEQVKAITLAAARVGGLDIDSRITEGFTPTLWDFFHQTDFWGPRNDRLTPLLIFDQFEEAFTIGKDQRRASGFLEQLADLAENRVPLSVEQRVKQSAERITIDIANPTYKIVLSLREDFVSRLDQLRPILPAIMRSRMALLPLDGGRALEVILNSGRPWVSEAVAQEIVAALAGESGAAGSAVGQAEIEPAFLSVMCHELFRRMVALGHSSITSELVAKERGEILEALYGRSLEGLSEPVRMFVEDRLLTASGFRGTVPLKEALAEGVSLQDLETLVDRRLLRFEDRLGTRHVELSHDLLTGVVKNSRALRAARVAREEEERKQRELRRALRRARRRSLIAASTALVAVGLCVFYWLGFIRETSFYYRGFTRQYGRVVPFGRLSAAAQRHRRSSYRVISKGFFGEILAVEADDSRGKQTLNNNFATLVSSDSSDRQGTVTFSRAEFAYENSGIFKPGIVVDETGWDPQHGLVYGLMYAPLADKTNSPGMRRATYVGPDGLPMPQRHSPAEVVQIEYNSVGYETRRRYLDLEGNPAPGADDAFGQEMKYDDKGREIRETSLDAAGHYVNDSSGNATQLEEYDTDGNVVVWRALDTSDQPTLLNTGGYAIQRVQYDRWGNWTDWAYFDVDGAPVIATDDGAHKTTAAHDDQGNIVELRYFDTRDQPMNLQGTLSYHLDKREYDSNNRLVRETYFDTQGKPVRAVLGAFDIRFGYGTGNPSSDNASEVSFYDEKGQPANDEDGVHLIRRVYDQAGRKTDESYYGLDSKPVAISKAEGFFHETRLSYDQRGRTIEETFYGVDGKRCAYFPAAFSKIGYTYDHVGNTTGTQFFDTDDKPLTSKESRYQSEKQSYNEFGEVRETSYYYAQEQPAALVTGIHRITNMYDNRGLLVQVANYDIAGNLVEDRNHVARTQYWYNTKRQQTAVEYFGPQGPVNGPAGTHRIETQYDTAGHKIQIEVTDLQGNVTITQFDAHGNKTGESHQAAPAKPKAQPKP